MIRRTTAVTVGVLAWLVLGAMSVGAQARQSTAAPPVAATAGPAVVSVDLSDTIDPRVDRGVLVRGGHTSAAPMLAVYLGLTVVGGTLALITARRRALAVKAAELVTGVVVGRRARAEFWHAGLRLDPVAGVGRGRFPARPAARSRLPMLVGSGDSVTIAERGPRPGRGR